MQTKKTNISLLILCLLILLNITTTNVQAQNYQLSISDIKHQLINTALIGNRQAHYFTFYITFTNKGDQPTDNITAFLEDPELNARLEITSFTLQSNQNKTILYEEWPTTLLGETTINITYNPTNPNIEQTQYNTGKKTYTFIIGSSPNTNQTPGFHIVLLIIALFLVSFIIKRRKR